MKTRLALKELDKAVVKLRSLLRSHAKLTESEQLFIENRLMIMSIEYNLWVRRKLKPNEGTVVQTTANEQVLDHQENTLNGSHQSQA